VPCTLSTTQVSRLAECPKKSLGDKHYTYYCWLGRRNRFLAAATSPFSHTVRTPANSFVDAAISHMPVPAMKHENGTDVSLTRGLMTGYGGVAVSRPRLSPRRAIRSKALDGRVGSC
jgi:hypothetical protein